MGMRSAVVTKMQYVMGKMKSSLATGQRSASKKQRRKHCEIALLSAQVVAPGHFTGIMVQFNQSLNTEQPATGYSSEGWRLNPSQTGGIAQHGLVDIQTMILQRS